MLAFALFQWWFGAGWRERVRNSFKNLRRAVEFFSMDILITTLFKPWRQIVTTTVGDEGLNGAMRALIDNLVSRCVGFMMRSTMLFIGVLSLLILSLISLLTLVIWPLVPLVPVGLVIWSLT